MADSTINAELSNTQGIEDYEANTSIFNNFTYLIIS